MDFKNLISWNRDGGAPVVRQREEDNPVFALHRDMNRVVDDFFRSFDLPTRFGSSFGSSVGWPTIELSESNKEIKVVAELPGVEEKDVDVSLDNGVLTTRGEKKGSSSDAVHGERWQDTFQRSVQLSPDADPEKIKTDFRNGVLSVTIAKRPDARRTACVAFRSMAKWYKAGTDHLEGAALAFMPIAKRQHRRAAAV